MSFKPTTIMKHTLCCKKKEKKEKEKNDRAVQMGFALSVFICSVREVATIRSRLKYCVL